MPIHQLPKSRAIQSVVGIHDLPLHPAAAHWQTVSCQAESEPLASTAPAVAAGILLVLCYKKLLA